jgi:hypothetical protein
MLLIPGLEAKAARIHSTSLSHAEQHDDALWANYLAAGTHEWLTHAHPPVTASLEAAVWKSLANGTSAANPMVQFLLWRQSLDPARFDFWHPRLAIAFAKLKTPSISSTTVVTPTTVTPNVGTSTQQVVPNIPPEAQLVPPVPEPGTLWFAAAGVAWACWTGRKLRATRKPAPNASVSTTI